MFIKKFKRKCDVRGCKNTANVFLISKRREMGNTIAICTDCLKEAQVSIDGYVEEKKTVIKKDKPLFPHPELAVTLSSAQDVEPEPHEVIDANAEDVHISVAEDTVTPHMDQKEPMKNPYAEDSSLETKPPKTAKRKTNKKK